MPHIKLEIVANEYQQEELIALFDDQGATGFEQTDEQLIAYFPQAAFAENEVLQLLQGYRFTQSVVEDKNWNESWEQNFKPVVVEQFVAVRAHFHPADTTVLHDLIITPKMSFGTGHHATTHLMLQAMQWLDFKGKTVFDFGTGTGILAILAEKLGAASVTAIDVDDWSLANALENIERNGCSRIGVSGTSVLPAERFHVVLANINRNVLLDYMPQLARLAEEKGQLLLSGLLVVDEAAIVAEAEKNGLLFERKTEREGWLALLFSNALPAK